MKKVIVSYKNKSRILDTHTFEEYENVLEKMSTLDLMDEERDVEGLQRMIEFFYKYKKYSCHNCGKMMRRPIEGPDQDKLKLYQCYECKSLRWI